MSETAQLAQKLISEGERLAAFFETLNVQQWNTEVYAEGSVWTIRSILAHLVSAERGFIQLFTSIRTGGPGAFEDFSIDRFNARQQEILREVAPSELLGHYRAVRAEMARFAASLEDSELEKAGRHPYLGQTSLREMLKMVYLHNQLHYRDIKKALQKA